MRNNLLRAHVALFIVALIYGGNYSVAKVVLDDDYLHPMAFISLRVLAGSLAFSLLHGWWVKQRVYREDIGRLLLCGLFGVALNQSLFFIGLDYTTPINASLIMTMTPVLVLIASALLLNESIHWKKVAGIIFGMAGAVILVMYGKKFAFNKYGWLGDLLVLINASSYGLYLVLVKPLLKRYHPLTVVKWVFLIGSIGVLPFGIPQLKQTAWQTFTLHVWLAIAYVLCCTTVLAYLLNVWAMRSVTPTVVGIYVYLQPVLATAIALMLGKDLLAWPKVVAGILIFLGVWLVSMPTPTQQPLTWTGLALYKKLKRKK